MDDNPFNDLAKRISNAEGKRLSKEKEITERLQAQFDAYNSMVTKTLTKLRDGLGWDGEINGSRPTSAEFGPRWELRFNKKGMYKPEATDNFRIAVYISGPYEVGYLAYIEDKFYFSAGADNSMMAMGIPTGLYDLVASGGPWELTESSLINGLKEFVERVVKTFNLF